MRKGVIQSRSFRSKAEAQAWARQVEVQADRCAAGFTPDRRTLVQITLADLLIRYRDEVIPKKRSRTVAFETGVINVFLRHRLASVRLGDLTAAMVAAYRDERLRALKPSSLNRQLDVFRHALTVATREWDIPLVANPFKDIARPKAGPGRDRRLRPGEWERIVTACRQYRQPHLLAMVELALQTAMRRGELLAARWHDIDLARRTWRIPVTKNGHPRTIRLTGRAVTILQTLRDGERAVRDGKGGEPVLPLSEVAMKLAWKRAVRRAQVDDLRFHDLRHEAVSRFFELGLSLPEVMLISGHRDQRMLLRYTHPNAERIAAKLAVATT